MPQRLIDIPLGSLVPSSNDWADGKVERWIGGIGNFEQMIGYGEIFWPEFQEHDGCILRAEVDEANYRDWMEQLHGDKQAVEKMLNHVDLEYLIPNNPELSPTDDQLTYLGRLLREMWQAKLSRQFPGRDVVVEFIDEGGDSPLITIYQPAVTEGPEAE